MRLLASRRITLRPVEESDIETILAWENDSDVWPVSDTSAPYSRRMIEEYVKGYRANLYAERQLRLIITLTDNGRSIGVVDLYDYDPANGRAMTGIYIDVRYRGMGHATEALNLLATYSCKHIGMHQLAALIAEDNTGSLRLYAKAGYHQTATLPGWFRRGGGYIAGCYFQQEL